jgi:hypothetical protein
MLRLFLLRVGPVVDGPGGPALVFLRVRSMLKQMKAAALGLSLAAAIAPCGARAASAASAADGAAVLWAANPVGAQSVPNVPAPLTLLPSNGYVPLQTSGGKCLLVARRGTQIVAVELSPVNAGGKLTGWKPQAVDMDTLTSKWGYQADAKSGAATSQLAQQNNSSINKDGSFSTSSAWGNTHVETIASGESQSSATVTVNGRTYRKYSHFKPATPDTPMAASDEYFCQ